MGAYIKTLARVVRLIPKNPSAAGALVGAINQLLTLISPFFLCQAMGQDQQNESTLFGYFLASLATQQPAATVLGGWPGLGYGSTGKGPMAPSTAPLLEGCRG